MDYGDLLRRSWNIIWNNKFMLVLGFLAALGSGVGSSNANYSMDSGDFTNFPVPPGRVEEVIAAVSAVVFLLICVAFVVGIVLWLIRLISQAGLISAASRLDAGEKVSFRDAFSAGWQKLWSLVGLNIVLYGVFVILGIIALVIFAGSIGAIVSAAVSGAGQQEIAGLAGGFGILALCLFCLLCILVPVGIIVTLIYPFAQRALVLENTGVIDSIRRGWNVIRANVGDVLILILLFLLLNLLVAVIVFAVLLPLGALTFGPLLVRLFSEGAIQPLDVGLAIVGGLAIGLIGAVINATYVAFRSTAVTLAYEIFIARMQKLPPATA